MPIVGFEIIDEAEAQRHSPDALSRSPKASLGAEKWKLASKFMSKCTRYMLLRWHSLLLASKQRLSQYGIYSRFSFLSNSLHARSHFISSAPAFSLRVGILLTTVFWLLSFMGAWHQDGSIGRSSCSFLLFPRQTKLSGQPQLPRQQHPHYPIPKPEVPLHFNPAQGSRLAIFLRIH